jgi:hypothetical protein
MSMSYLNAKEAMEFLLACGVDAEFQNNREDSINVYDDDHFFLFCFSTDEEWQFYQQVILKIARGLNGQPS